MVPTRPPGAANLPFTFFFTKFMSGSRESTELFLDPSSALGGDVQGIAKLEKDVAEDARITTTIVAHERTFKCA